MIFDLQRTTNSHHAHLCIWRMTFVHRKAQNTWKRFTKLYATGMNGMTEFQEIFRQQELFMKDTDTVLGLLLEVPASHQSCHLIWQVASHEIRRVFVCVCVSQNVWSPSGNMPETTALSPGWKGDVSSSSPCAAHDQRRWSPKRDLQIERSIQNI